MRLVAVAARLPHKLHPHAIEASEYRDDRVTTPTYCSILQLYDLGEMATLAELPGAFMLGAGAGSSRVAGVNCEVCVQLCTCQFSEFWEWAFNPQD